uniref:SAM domain-containing protein n=1 Tax=Onchocerca volvulus TaxID=6282 RepID=A0A8R1Y872_ONCVO
MQKNGIVCNFFSHQTLDMTMRLKKSESCDDFGHNEVLHPQKFRNNNYSKLIKFGEIMKTNAECHSTHTQPVDDITDNDADDDNDSGVHRGDESRFGIMRRFGGVKSVGAIRKQWHHPVAEVVFPNNTHARKTNKDGGGFWSTISSGFAKRISNNSSSTDDRSPTPPPSLGGYLFYNFFRNIAFFYFFIWCTHESLIHFACAENACFAAHSFVDTDAAHRIDASESSPSSSNDMLQQSILRKSCPDLRISSDNGAIMPKNMETYRAQNRNRRAHEKKQAALWKKKPIAEWSLDDVLLWLQYCKLDNVASVMIGYDISGADVERWDNDTLEKLGITAEQTRNKILQELQALKAQQTNPSVEINEGSGTRSKKGKPLVPLFKLVRSTSYDKVVAVETPLTTRDITVAEGRFGCLQVTKVNGANIPLREQDCFLEINEMPGQAFRSPLMFTKLVTEAAGEPIRLVVLRRRLLPTGDTTGNYDHDNDTSGRGTFFEKTLQAVDQESSASSGVSSSELSSEIVLLNDDNKSQVLRL